MPVDVTLFREENSKLSNRGAVPLHAQTRLVAPDRFCHRLRVKV
jgi:hypothetical protein